MEKVRKCVIGRSEEIGPAGQRAGGLGGVDTYEVAFQGRGSLLCAP